MELTRRGFLGLAGTGILAPVLGSFLIPGKARAARGEFKIARTTETTSICPYCGVGCGMIVHTRKEAPGGKIVNIEGDPDHPINLGSVCSKGAALYQVANNDRRLTQVLYRAPNSDRWEAKDWDWAVKKIAANIKKTRDATFKTKDEKGRVVNRTEGIACLGGAALDSEECYVYSKFARALGVVYLEHQARI
jgi:formate dehydrogenase major subunit